jgi:hypothetical protein
VLSEALRVRVRRPNTPGRCDIGAAITTDDGVAHNGGRDDLSTVGAVDDAVR